MSDTLFVMNYESLGRWLEKLKIHPMVLSSNELQDSLENALGFYRDLQKEYEHILTDNQQLAQEITRLKQQHPIVVADETFTEIFPHYQRLYAAGGDAKLIYRLAVMNGVDEVIRLKILRSLFNLSLAEAQAIAESAEPLETLAK